MTAGRSRLSAVPCSRAQAQRYVAEHHRHHRPAVELETLSSSSLTFTLTYVRHNLTYTLEALSSCTY